MTEIITTLIKLAALNNMQFTLYTQPISYEEVFAATGLLPILAQRAEQRCLFTLGYGIGAKFIEEQQALLGIRVQFDEITPMILQLLYLYDVLLEFQPATANQQIALDELLYE